MTRILLTSVARITVLFTALVLGACGGGGGGAALAPAPTTPPPQAPPPPAQEKGIEGGGIVSRFGTNFNSITVGDVTYDTTSATLSVTVDDQSATLADLNVGNVVRVMATTSDDGVTALATQIAQVNDLEGPVAAGSIDLGAGTFEVLGQTVRVVATTIFDDAFSPRSLAGISDNDALEVSVLADGGGAFIATRIEPDDDSGEFEITGAVSNLDAANFLFNIGALTVDYSQAMLQDFDGGSIAAGDIVEVEGTAFGIAGELIADVVEDKSPAFTGNDGDFGELEGFVTRFVSSTDFDVAGIAVTTTAQTVFEDGSVSDLMQGVRVDIDGVIDANGVLVASEVDFEDREDDAEVELSAPIESIDGAAGTVVVLGRAVTINDSTVLEDASDAQLDPFTLADLAVGDFIEIRAYIDAANSAQLVAVVVERDDEDDDDVEIKGPVDSVAMPDLSVVGVAVATLGTTEFELANDMPVNSTDFFAAVTAGTQVKAKGTWDGATLTAREVEIED